MTKDECWLLWAEMKGYNDSYNELDVEIATAARESFYAAWELGRSSAFKEARER